MMEVVQGLTLTPDRSWSSCSTPEVQAGNNYLTSVPASTGVGGGDTQGCLVPPLPIEILLLFTFVSVLSVAIISDFILKYCLKRDSGPGKRVNSDGLIAFEEEILNSLLGWMIRVVRESIWGEDGSNGKRFESLGLKQA